MTIENGVPSLEEMETARILSDVKLLNIELPPLPPNEKWTIEKLEQTLSEIITDCKEEDKPLLTHWQGYLRKIIEANRMSEENCSKERLCF